MRQVIVDTGPIVAFLDHRDAWHTWAVEAFETAPAPMLACEAVITEACFLVRGLPGGVDGVVALVDRGLIDLSFQAQPVMADLRRLMSRYGDVPMAFADACLVRMSEERAGVPVMTLDDDFRRYRRLGRQVIPLISPGHSVASG